MVPRLLVLLSCMLLYSCTNTSSNTEVEVAKEPVEEKDLSSNCQMIEKDTTLEIKGVKVDIKVPSGEVKGDLLVLPGWSFLVWIGARKRVCVKKPYKEGLD